MSGLEAGLGKAGTPWQVQCSWGWGVDGKKTQPCLDQDGSWKILRKAVESGEFISDTSCLSLLSVLFEAGSNVSQTDLKLAL